MARSLVIQQEETPRTSSLFTTFLVLSCGWMLAGAIASSADAAEHIDDIDPGPSLHQRVLP